MLQVNVRTNHRNFVIPIVIMCCFLLGLAVPFSIVKPLFDNPVTPFISTMLVVALLAAQQWQIAFLLMIVAVSWTMRINYAKAESFHGVWSASERNVDNNKDDERDNESDSDSESKDHEQEEMTRSYTEKNTIDNDKTMADIQGLDDDVQGHERSPYSDARFSML